VTLNQIFFLVKFALCNYEYSALSKTFKKYNNRFEKKKILNNFKKSYAILRILPLQLSNVDLVLLCMLHNKKSDF